MGMKQKLVMGGVTMLMAVAMIGCGKQAGNTGSVSPAAVQEKQEEAQNEDVKSATTLKDGFINDFTVGVAVPTLVDGERTEFVKKHFNSITMENSMKPESLLDWEGSEKSKDGMPVIKEKELGEILQMAKDAGIKLRGHCLVWHSQTPQWFFSKDYEPSNGYVDKKTMKKRMEAYIQKVLTFCEENYPGVVYAWDVVNEAMGDDGWYRSESGWYEIYGDESYITDAFTYARKYAGKDVKLFYNDYNEYTAEKRDLIFALLKSLREKGLVDGMGMQSHWDMEYPSVTLFETALEKYGEIDGLEIQLTEIDMHNTDDSEEGIQKQAERYKEFFEVITNADRTGKANITNVTFWGLTDSDSWLSGFKGEVSYPLLFTDDLEEKPCYASILEVAKAK